MASIFNPVDDEELARDFKRVQLTPEQQIGMRMRESGRMADEGLETAMRGVLGAEPSLAVRRNQAGMALRDLAKTTKPGTDEFYSAAVDILGKHGLGDEAELMAAKQREAEVVKAGDDPVLKAQRTLDQLNKRLAAGDTTVKPAIAALEQFLSTYGKPREGTTPSDPDFIKLLNQKEAALKAGDTERAAAIDEEIKARRAGKPADKSLSDYEKFRIDQAKAKEKADQDAGVRAGQAAIGAMDIEIQASERLLAHPGLALIVGSKWGALPDTAAALRSGPAADAMAIYRTVTGQTFIRALQDLKATSKVGASGLGQLTEREGDKIQQARTSLHRQQRVEQFQRSLQSYIQQLNVSRGKFGAEIQRLGGQVPAPPPAIHDSPAPPRLPDAAVPEGTTARERKATDIAPPKRKLKATRIQ